MNFENSQIYMKAEKNKNVLHVNVGILCGRPELSILNAKCIRATAMNSHLAIPCSSWNLKREKLSKNVQMNRSRDNVSTRRRVTTLSLVHSLATLKIRIKSENNKCALLLSWAKLSHASCTTYQGVALLFLSTFFKSKFYFFLWASPASKS